jgi:hypothetical protein
MKSFAAVVVNVAVELPAPLEPTAAMSAAPACRPDTS